MYNLEHSHKPEAIAARLSKGPKASYIRDWVYGGIDGAITTFAIVAGAIGAELANRYILILGIANLLADGLSMASANYFSTRSEIEEYEQMRRMEERHIDTVPDGEREEVRQIFAAKGFMGQDLERAVTVITAERERWVATMMAEEHGLPAVNRSAITSATATFVAFCLCGAVPLIPFVFDLPGASTLAAAMTGAVFFAIGSIRSRWSPKSWWLAGAETLTIGIAAASVAYLVGDVLHKVL
jgi:VIT1/CCC1 family predicted Fe2+/Mn2+ transporter